MSVGQKDQPQEWDGVGIRTDNGTHVGMRAEGKAGFTLLTAVARRNTLADARSRWLPV